MNLSNGFDSVYMGKTADELEAEIRDSSYPAAVFTDTETLERVLRDLSEADQGMSVVVSGDYRTTLEVAKSVGLKPHTINVSLGIFGRTADLPEPAVLDIATMCGHALVTPMRIHELAKKVARGRLSLEEAGRDLARTCTCGVFNPHRAADILSRYIGGKEREE
ncbi:MAG: hypothetical protein AB1576_13290 [Bacillota bacterium]